MSLILSDFLLHIFEEAMQLFVGTVWHWNDVAISGAKFFDSFAHVLIIIFHFFDVF